MLLAHALSTPIQAPLPLSVFLVGASVVLLFSFVALGRLWRTSRFEGGRSWPLPPLVQQLARVAGVMGRVVALVVFVAAFWSGVAGRDLVDANFAPRAVYVVFWVGLTVVSALFGDVWRAVSPFDTLCAIGQWLRDRTGRTGAPPKVYPLRWGYWPAAAGLLAFLWLELVYSDAADPRNVALAMEVYTLAVLAGAATWGRTWLQRGEPFAVYFGLLAHMAPFFRADDGTVRMRAPLAGLAQLGRVESVPGTAAVVFVALGSTSFDGLSRTGVWAGLVAGQDATELMLSGTLGLVWMIVTAYVLYGLSMRLAGRLAGRDDLALVTWFLPSIVPIVFGYAVAHYFTLLIFESQTAMALASDPLGRGANYFGTATWAINPTLITTAQVAWVQAGSIVVGHIAGVVAAHDRAVARLGDREVTRSQFPLLGAMVLYTVGGLALLFGT
jgi:hypothetical protein